MLTCQVVFEEEKRLAAERRAARLSDEVSRLRAAQIAASLGEPLPGNSRPQHAGTQAFEEGGFDAKKSVRFSGTPPVGSARNAASVLHRAVWCRGDVSHDGRGQKFRGRMIPRADMWFTYQSLSVGSLLLREKEVAPCCGQCADVRSKYKEKGEQDGNGGSAREGRHLPNRQHLPHRVLFERRVRGISNGGIHGRRVNKHALLVSKRR